MGEPRARTQIRVLVIDDERAVRDTIVRQLAGCGFRAVGAAGGEEGLEFVKKEGFDAVVCDVSMPGLGGFGTLRALKQLVPSPLVIMATGFATAEQASDLLAAGAYDCLPKPFPIKRLVGALEAGLGPFHEAGT